MLNVIILGALKQYVVILNLIMLAPTVTNALSLI